MRNLLFLALLFSFQPAVSADQEIDDAAPAAEQAMDCEEAITTFQDVSRIGRKDGAAKNMTRRHKEMAESGWRFVDMEVYTENGDLEGFYLSYTRTVTCSVEDSGDE